MTEKPTISIIGGTGNLGAALARRLAKAGLADASMLANLALERRSLS